MSKESSSPAPRINRLGIGINVAVQTILVVLIILIINYVGFHYFRIWDFSREKSRTLSDKTLQILKTVPPDFKIVALYSPRYPMAEEIQNLLNDLRVASGDKIEVEFVNQYGDYQRASELQRDFGFKDDENALIVTAKGRSKVINPAAMTEWDRSGMMQGLPPRPTAFRGEQVLASAMIEVTEEKPRKVYFLGGHGELDVLGSENFLAFRSSIEGESIKVQGLNLLNASDVPADASAIVIPGAQFDLTSRELEILQQYWDRKGRLFVLLDPNGKTPGLDTFLTNIGIKPENNRVIALGKAPDKPSGTRVENRVVGVFTAQSPVTRSLQGVASVLPAPVKSLSLMEQAVKGKNTKLIPLFVVENPGYWGETVFDLNNLQRDEGVDFMPPLVIFAQAEKGAVGDNRVQLDSSRVVVTGTSKFVHNEGMLEETRIFLISAVNWLTDREEIIGVPPKEYKLLNVDIKDDQMKKLTLLVLFVIPGSAAVAGFLVWWRRRN